MTRLEEIDLEIAELYKIIRLKESVWDHSKSWEEYNEYMSPENRQIGALDREKRMLMPYELSEIPTYGDVMSLKNFVGHVKNGMFIDYDGSGHYVKDGKMTDIYIYPSDVKYNSVRNDFDTIIWFNR